MMTDSTFSYWTMIIETTIALAVVALAAWLFLKYASPKLNIAVKGKSKLKVEDKIILGKNQTLFVVKFESERLLIGASENSISLIKELGKDTSENQGLNDVPGR